MSQQEIRIFKTQCYIAMITQLLRLKAGGGWKSGDSDHKETRFNLKWKADRATNKSKVPNCVGLHREATMV